jgi:hypothetical protein
MELQKEINYPIIIARSLNTSFNNYRIRKQKINKNLQALKNTINQLDLIGIYKTLHSTTAEYTLFSNSRRTFTMTDHFLGHETGLNKCKIINFNFCSLTTVELN